MTFGYKDNFHFRSIRIEDEKKVRNIIFPILKSYGLALDLNGVDSDLMNITEHYRQGLFGVVELEGSKELIGSFALYPMGNGVVELRKMYLLEEYRGKGIGKWIITFCENYAKEQSYKKVILETASVLKGAIILYRKLGYMESKEALHTERCDIILEKVL
ncbi:GNAT family N-acetyltransferase [Saprospiraceae bacterium]|nr:GNAT family N-acetyltransferase [Saprospiraceae bacterium]